MSLTNTISNYDPAWPAEFSEEAARLTPVFISSLVTIHHVCSTSVPDLMAKPEIDLMVVVEDTGEADQWTATLVDLGYRRGGDLSPRHLFYKKDMNGVRTRKIHVCRSGHDAINRMLRFRNHLRQRPETRKNYQELKLELERENSSGIQEYLEGKARFIEDVLSRDT